MESLIELEPTDLLWALGMVAITIGLSSWQNLGLEIKLATATVRTILQLTVLGYVLAATFVFNNPIVVLIILGVMLAITAVTVRNRIGKKIPQLLLIVLGSMFFSTVLTLSYTVLLIIQPDNWYEPQYLIPLGGVVLGSAMNGAAVAGERLVSKISNSQLEIETHLSLGATPQQAMAGYRKEAIRAGLIPTLNQMMVIGIITLPGLMSGQLLSGTDPLNAASYQILTLFMLVVSNLMTTLLVTQGLTRQFFNAQAQLRLI